MNFFNKIRQNSRAKAQDANPPTVSSDAMQIDDDGDSPMRVTSDGRMSQHYAPNAVDRERQINMHERVRPQRAVNVFSAPLALPDRFVVPVVPKREDAVAFIDNSLADNFIFASLTREERRMLINAMNMDILPAGAIIIRQGDSGDFFYIVEHGTVSFLVDGNLVGSCSRGASFGELALLYNCPRAATCIANTDCCLWKVDQKTFRYMLANNNADQQKDIQDTLRKVPFLSELDDSILLRIADALTTVTFSAGERIINKGDVGEVFYIIRDGTVKVHDIGFGDSQYVDQFLGPGDWFGERALLTGEPRVANCTATTNCSTLCLSRETFEITLGPLQGLIDHEMKKRNLMGVPIFANSRFQSYEMSKLTEMVREVIFPAGEVLATEGQPCIKSLYIIRSGRVTIINDNGMINDLRAGDYFGEMAIQEEENTVSRQTITVQETAMCGVLSRADIETVIGSVQRLGKPLPPIASKLDRSIKLRDLVQLQILGVGTFGKVWLVSHKKSGKSYALKVLSKKEVIGHHQVDGVIREKNIMSSLTHPFVVNLISTFQDERNLYMLIELVQGGELFSVIHTESRDGIPNTNARFYAACILESLAYLHYRSIAYRDIKPENVLIDAQGYGVLVDLGFAKIVMDKTYTLCGTPEYLAPEIILSKGHDKGVDYWAFGVLVYEMLVGRSPFYSYGTDQVSLFKRIVQVKYAFPSGGIVNEVAQDLIQRVLVRSQAKRLGCLARGILDIHDHAWFSVIDFDKLFRRQLQAPWVPQLRDAFDASHFDSYKNVENESNSSKSALSIHQQELFRDF